ncbi:c-5 sterol desaturase [Tulasnella sp. 330]|nr:c-5 sterol desaturase [Tulasnella sp. 330]KAG8877081.1 c-5 sterol desaturase [Tulasnella sp. 332]KAG8882752.1 c-5 sterol desaturase [Tulasnella sp. 331]
MDVILGVADEFLLDKFYAKVLPVTAFINHHASNTSSSPLATLSATPSWSSIVQTIPHPPLPSVASGSGSDAVNLSAKLALSAWPRDYLPRQIASITVITMIGIHLLYFIFATLSYYFIFNHEMMKHPRFLKNQVRLEIKSSLTAFPLITFLTLPWFIAEVRGWSKLYDGVGEYGWTYLILSVPFYLLFTDYCIYWIHRWLHHPVLYKRLHKPHHKWLVPTPFASHAFHPVDGYLQSVPYHLFIFIFPQQRYLYLVLFVLVNFWSIFIHDSDMISGHALADVINGPSHHTLHHLYFNCNYGQYFTWADRVGGSYKAPRPELDPLLEVQALEAKPATLKQE